ncbi:MAG: hypothetical protein Ta2B_03280 [Termitinemataceae bacterium]|nr:MAG: hypothetical protein Ta2B_03280 [Termitinemataceae bacterium]
MRAVAITKKIKYNNFVGSYYYKVDKRSYVTILKKFITLSSILIVFTSCATKSEDYKKIDRAVATYSYNEAVSIIVDAQTPAAGKKKPKKPIYRSGNSILMYLDKGLLEHYAGRYENSYKDLIQAERAIEDAYTKSITQNAASFIANDNTKDYAGEDYEDIYVNIFNALNAYHAKNGQALALLNDLTAAGGELVKISQKYDQDDKKAKSALTSIAEGAGTVFTFGTVQWPEQKPITFTNSALARYLSAVFLLADGNKDSARFNMFELQNAYKTPIYKNAGLKIPAALVVSGARGDETGPLLDIPKGMGQLNVLAFSGLSPIKKESIDYVAFPFLIPFYPALLNFPSLASGQLKIPVLVKRTSTITGVSVAVEGGKPFKLDMLEDIGAVVTDTFNGRISSIYVKTYSRVVGKLIVAAISGKAAEEAAIQSGVPDILAQLAGIAVLKSAQATLDSGEAADIRCGRYFPDKAYIGAVNLAPNTYTITINYEGGEKITKQVEIKAGAITLVETTCLK